MFCIVPSTITIKIKTYFKLGWGERTMTEKRRDEPLMKSGTGVGGSINMFQ